MEFSIIAAVVTVGIIVPTAIGISYYSGYHHYRYYSEVSNESSDT